MAAGLLPKPGTRLGPCRGSCRHLDCAETRRMADTLCDICHKPIGYDALFYRGDTIEHLTHEGCAARLAEHAQGYR